MKPLSANARNLAKTLIVENCIRSIGGLLYGKDPHFLMRTADLPDVIKELEKHGVSIRRVDAGGSPTWGLV